MNKNLDTKQLISLIEKYGKAERVIGFCEHGKDVEGSSDVLIRARKERTDLYIEIQKQIIKLNEKTL